MIHDLDVPRIAPPRAGGRAQFGTMTAADAEAIAAMGEHHNAAGQACSRSTARPCTCRARAIDFRAGRAMSCRCPLSMGAYNCLQQSDCHAYWEFNEYTNWVFPLYELPFTGGVPGTFAAAGNTTCNR